MTLHNATCMTCFSFQLANKTAPCNIQLAIELIISICSHIIYTQIHIYIANKITKVMVSIKTCHEIYICIPESII